MSGSRGLRNACRRSFWRPRAPQLRRVAPAFALRQVRELRWRAALLREARMKLDAGEPFPSDCPVSAEALEDYDLMAPALEPAALSHMAVPRLLKRDMRGP